MILPANSLQFDVLLSGNSCSIVHECWWVVRPTKPLIAQDPLRTNACWLCVPARDDFAPYIFFGSNGKLSEENNVSFRQVAFWLTTIVLSCRTRREPLHLFLCYISVVSVASGSASIVNCFSVLQYIYLQTTGADEVMDSVLFVECGWSFWTRSALTIAHLWLASTFRQRSEDDSLMIVGLVCQFLFRIHGWLLRPSRFSAHQFSQKHPGIFQGFLRN